MDVLCTNRSTSEPIRMRSTATVEQISDIYSDSSSYPNSMSPTATQRLLYPAITETVQTKPFPIRDLDWEYPPFRGGKPRDRENYAQFVQELREEFELESTNTGRSRLLLTMAVPAGIEYIKKGYDVKKLNRYLDWFNLLSYDYHSAFEPSVNHHAPLYSLEEESEYNYDSELNIDFSIKYYLNEGADRDKLVLGIPTYGRSYTLLNVEVTDIGAPTDGPGAQGDATREKGYL